MSTEFLEIANDPKCTVFTIRRESRRNAIHGPLWWALRDQALALYEQPPRSLVITGAGGHFSAGMDLKPDNPLFARLFPAIQAGDRELMLGLIRELKGVVDAIANVPCPTIAAIEGTCTGGGLEVALACDFRIASKSAVFSLPEARVGMMPDVGGSVRLSRLVGANRAMDLILTNRQIDAETALRWGLINGVVDAGGALEGALAMSKELRTSAPSATREVLTLLRNPNPTFDAETLAGASVLASGDAIEGVMAFLEKRATRWSE